MRDVVVTDDFSNLLSLLGISLHLKTGLQWPGLYTLNYFVCPKWNSRLLISIITFTSELEMKESQEFASEDISQPSISGKGWSKIQF